MFNSIILHHLSENANLVYGILSAHKTFEDLGTFTLSRGLREIKRVQLAKEEQMHKPDGNTNGKGSADFGESIDPGAEKNRLLETNRGASNIQGDSAENMYGTQYPYSEGQEVRRDVELEVMTQSFMSPGSDSPLNGNVATTTSEKARGKMKERQSLSLETTSSLDRVAATGVGRNGFVPTQEWVGSNVHCLSCSCSLSNPRLPLGIKGRRLHNHVFNLITDQSIDSPLTLLCC